MSNISKKPAEFSKISVVTPSYQQAEFLEKTINSVLEQGYPNLEYIVIDGGSIDGSVNIIRRYEKYLAYWESNPDRGQSHAINKGFEKSSGEILCWINSDDLLEKGALHAVSELLTNPQKPEWLVGTSRLIDPNGHLIEIRQLQPISATTFLLWNSRWFPQQSTFWTRTMWEETGALDENLNYVMDLDLWRRMYAVSEPILTEMTLSSYRYHKDAKCVSNLNAVQEEFISYLRCYLATVYNSTSGTGKSESLCREPIVEIIIDLVNEYDKCYADTADLRRLSVGLNRLKSHIVIGRIIRLGKKIMALRQLKRASNK